MYWVGTPKSILVILLFFPVLSFLPPSDHASFTGGGATQPRPEGVYWPHPCQNPGEQPITPGDKTQEARQRGITHESGCQHMTIGSHHVCFWFLKYVIQTAISFIHSVRLIMWISSVWTESRGIALFLAITTETKMLKNRSTWSWFVFKWYGVTHAGNVPANFKLGETRSLLQNNPSTQSYSYCSMEWIWSSTSHDLHATPSWSRKHIMSCTCIERGITRSCSWNQLQFVNSVKS